MQKRIARLAFERGWLLGLVVLVAYVWLAPGHIVAGDNAEFSTLGAIGGHAHPSGYPLYILWLRATAWLPAGSAAHRAALATAFLAALQVVVLHAACRAWGARATAATMACAVFAAAPIVLRVHTEADVFALNSLVASALLWLAAAKGPLRGRWRCAILGLIAGLGMANNLTCVLLAPIGILGVVRGAREASGTVASVGAAALGLAAGLLPYAYLFVAPDPASWGPVDSLGDLLHTFLRRDYGTFSHLPNAPDIPLATSLGWHATLIGRTWLWAPAVLGVAMLGWRAVRSDDRWGWRMLAASWLLAGPLFVTRLGIDPHDVGAYIGGRMQILSAVVLAIPIACGFDLAVDRLRGRVSDVAAALLAIVVFAGLVVVALPKLQRVHSPVVELGVRNMLRALPPAAIIVVVSEDQCFGGHYLQLTQGERPDVAIVCWTITSHDWYLARLARDGVRLAPTGGLPMTVAQGEALLATGRPLLVDRAQTELLATLPSYPVGVLHRVLAPGAKPPSLGEVVELDRTLFAAFDLDYPRPHRDDDFAAVAHRRYAETWRILASALDGAGDHDAAASARDFAAQLAPED